MMLNQVKSSHATSSVPIPDHHVSVFYPSAQQQRYNGVPIISFNSGQRPKKKKSQSGGQQQTNPQRKPRKYVPGPARRGFNPTLPAASWDDRQRCSEFVGEPLVMVPRGTGRGGHQQHFYPISYGAYPTVMTFADAYHSGQQAISHYFGQHFHRDSFSSCSSSSDANSSGASSPVYFSGHEGDLSHHNGQGEFGSAPRREWISKVSRDHGESGLGIHLRVMSYNILAEQYASKKIHSYCPSWALAWSYRKERIREDIELHSADIACLQEVPMGEFYNYFLGILRTQGYDGLFSPKSRAHTMATKDRLSVDGCAIVFRKDKFDLVNQHLVEFNQLAIKNADGSNDMINRVMTKDNIALCAVLRVTEAVDPTYLLVINVHVHWDPAFSDVKLIQTMLLMCEVEKLVKKTKLELGVEDVPIIFCGDMNSLPDSGVIEFLRAGRVSVDHPDFRDLPYFNCLQKLSSQGHVSPQGQFLHPFGLRSAYDENDMPFTNYTADFKGVIDYIFVGGNRIKPLAVLGPVENTWWESRKPVGFPCPQIPSDHLPLVVELELAA